MTPPERIRHAGRALHGSRLALQARREAGEQRGRLGGHRLFAACSKAELRALQRWGDEFEVPAGVVLLRKGTIGRCVIAVLEGSATSTTGPRRRPERITAGGWVGDRAVLAFAPEPATVVTETPCRLFTLGARPAMSFSVDMKGMRSALFPSLDERSAKQQVRSMRAEGLAEWKRLGPKLPGPAVDGPLPQWFQVYKTGPARSEDGALLTSRATCPPLAPRAEPRRLTHPRRVGVIAAVSMLTLLTSLVSCVRLPYYRLAGSTRSAVDAVHVKASAPEQSGRILFPVVDVSKVTILGALRGWYDIPELRTSEEVLGGQSAADVDRANREMMVLAKRDAIAVVGNLLPDVPIDRRLVEIDSDDIGGPSAGLAFALALIDESTPGDLTGGDTIAATGQVTPEGVVRSVGGIRLKALAARRAGCDLFIVPLANLHEAKGVAGPMRLLGVESVAEAVQKLVAAGGALQVPRRP